MPLLLLLLLEPAALVVDPPPVVEEEPLLLELLQPAALSATAAPSAVIARIALRIGSLPLSGPHVAYPREAPPICLTRKTYSGFDHDRYELADTNPP